MLKMTTKDAVEKYLSENPNAEKVKYYLDREEIFEYEAELGKQLLEMNADEIIVLLSRLRNQRNGKKYSMYNYERILVMWRAFANWYSREVEIIAPHIASDPKLRRKQLTAALSEKDGVRKNKISQNDIDQIISKMQDNEVGVEADYCESVIWLIYCGVKNIREIIEIETDMVDLDAKTIRFEDRSVHLTDRCVDLLRQISAIDTYKGYRKTLYAFKYRPESFFPLFGTEKMADNIENRNLTYLSEQLTQKVMRKVKKYNEHIILRDIYFLGFVHYLRSNVSETDLKIMIGLDEGEDNKSSQYARKFLNLVMNYGAIDTDISRLKSRIIDVVSD